MPRVTISINAPQQQHNGELVTLDLPGDVTIAGLKSSVEAETNLPINSQHFFLNGSPLLGDSRTLSDAGISDGEMLALFINSDPMQSSRSSRPNQASNGAASGRQRPSPDELETLRLRLLSDSGGQARLREQNPDLIATLYDRDRFRETFYQMLREDDERARERAEQARLLEEDPFNTDAQIEIEKRIQQNNVMENLRHALEENPEVFGRVTMLYINAEVNGYPVKAFVDSGAQATIMSPSCAEACGIMRLIDTRYAGIARGVGTAKILGRVHHAVIKIGDAELPSAFTVMEGKDVDLLLGLDMLKRYQACIDLQQGVLRFQGNEVPFLPESEIPKYIEEAELNEPTLAGPNGTEIGARSGAVRPVGGPSAPGPSSGPSPENSSNFKGSGRTLKPETTSQRPQPAQRSTPANFPQESINQLQSLGFSRDEAIRALEATGGNVEYAAGLLFQG